MKLPLILGLLLAGAFTSHAQSRYSSWSTRSYSSTIPTYSSSYSRIGSGSSYHYTPIQPRYIPMMRAPSYTPYRSSYSSYNPVSLNGDPIQSTARGIPPITTGFTIRIR